jgi:hypothetical protein
VLDRIQISDSPDRPLDGTGCFADIKRDFLVKLFILREKSACHPEGSMVNYPCGKSFCFPAMAMHL